MQQSQQRILFLLCRFLDGGIDTVAVEYLNRLAQVPNLKITLGVMVGMGNLEVFRDRLAPSIEVKYCVKDGWLSKTAKLRAYKRLPFLAKLFDESILTPLRNLLIYTRLRELTANCDAVVDFDFHAATYLRCCAAKKIAFYHFSFQKKLGSKQRHIARFDNKLAVFDHVVTLCDAMHQEATQMFPRHIDKFCIIHNACNRALILQKASELPDNPLINCKYIVAVERLNENQKDISTLLRAYALYRQRATDKLPLLIIGNGPSEQHLRSLAAELGITENVVFIGFLANPYPWIARAEVLAHSAKFEGFGMSLVEAIILGRVAVSTDCPVGPREILDNGNAGLLVEVGNAEQMADALLRATTDFELRSKLVAAAVPHSDNFTFARTIPKFLELLQK